MANEEHVAKLKEGVESWNSWVEEGGIDFCADLRGVDFSGVNLSGVNLLYANLDCATFVKTNITHSNLIEVNLNKANLQEADFCYANLYKATLSDANLKNATLRDANLGRANLDGANLEKANLYRASLVEASLSKTNLSNAHVNYAGLNGVNLCDANLSNAHLGFTNFNGADLRRADFSGAEFYETILSDTDLSAARGLDNVKHQGPSGIDHRTIQKTSPPLSDHFLRGCGLSELLIDYYPTLLNQPIQFYSCFISYSHDDKVFARRLRDQLQGRGIRCWLDEHQMLAGDDIYEQVDRGIKLWDKTLLCCSESSLNSWWVDGEIDTAFAKERQLMKEREQKILALIPLNLDGYLFSGKWKNGKEQQVKSRFAPDFTGWEKENQKFEDQFEKLVKALQTDDSGREKPPPPQL